jgi:hypothetical protein
MRGSVPSQNDVREESSFDAMNMTKAQGDPGTRLAK